MKIFLHHSSLRP